MNHATTLTELIKKKEAKIGIIGIGYVGSALAEAATEKKMQVLGFTRSNDKAKRINAQKNKYYKATADNTKLSTCDVVVICVPTPIHEDKTPDLEPLESSLQNTASHLRPGQLVIVESTIACGMTREIALPILASSGLIPEQDFFLAFSPERVDPGNPQYTVKNTPKVVAGLSDASRDLCELFYKQFVEHVVPVSSLEAAELSKLLENTFRLVNVSMMNELLPYAKRRDINLWEVISASSTKPFGFMPHFPGPGIGGHCIPVDPHYLLADSRKLGINLSIIEAAGAMNDIQPRRVVEKTVEVLSKTNGQKKNHSLLLVGVSYKADVDDVRESPALKIWEFAEQHGFSVSYYDPHVSFLNGTQSVSLSDEMLSQLDIMVIVTNHSSINYEQLLKSEIPIIDTRNVYDFGKHPNVYRL